MEKFSEYLKGYFKKIGYLISVVSCICVILGVSLLGNKALVDSDKSISNATEEADYNISNNEIGNQSPVIIGDNNTINYGDNSNNNSETEYILEDQLPEESSSIIEHTNITQKEFVVALNNIYENEDKIDEQKEKHIYSSIYPGVSYYYILDKICLIEITNGFRNINCSRAYQFSDNGKLYFALIVDDSGEHRLYFYNDILIRYIDENKNNHDINYDLDNYKCEWTGLALEESYEIFNSISESSVQNDFSVDASYDMNTPQSSISGIDVLIKAKTSFPADHVTISAKSDETEERVFDMHGGTDEWYFKSNFYIKGTYTIKITAYNSEGESVSDTITYNY